MIHEKIIARTCGFSSKSLHRHPLSINFHHNISRPLSTLRVRTRNIGNTSTAIRHLSNANSSNLNQRREERQQRRKNRFENVEEPKNEWNSNSTSISSQFLESASSYISTIRLMVASRLTSSLPDNDREQLLKSLNVNVNGNAGDKDPLINLQHGVTETTARSSSRSSIGEEVAVIEVREASSKTNSAHRVDDEELRIIWEKAEKAAMERVKSDLLIQERRLALERWKAQLEEEKEKGKNTKYERDEPDAVEIQKYMQRRHKEHLKQDDTDANGDTNEIEECHEDVHPVLGPVLIDLGYKRIHIVSAKALCAIQVWEKQRVYRHDRAKVMASDKLRTLNLGLPGIIALHESQDGQLTIIDGQHRIGMMSLLEEKELIPDNAIIDLNRILVEVFPQPTKTPPSPTNDNDDNHAKEIFTEINKAEPVKLVDMPGVAKVTDRRIIDGAASTLAETYPAMFKPSQKCRAPHLNLDNLRDAIFAAGVLKRHSIRNQKALVDWMMSRNEEMRMKYDIGGESTKNTTAETKARRNHFYLGLGLEWLYD